MRIAVIGAGYVGYSLALLLGEAHDVICLDIDSDKVDAINSGKSPINSEEIEEYLSDNKSNIRATTDMDKAIDRAEIIIIATPTNYNSDTKRLDTTIIDKVIGDIVSRDIRAKIVIKSTLPIGYTRELATKYNLSSLYYVPEFLREAHSISDNRIPSRIVVGMANENRAGAMEIAELMRGIGKADTPIYIVNSTEAETIKLFSNTYLAMRLDFFNSLDTLAMAKDLDSKAMIEAICEDERIGKGYNIPSFGFGGYCLPKDTMETAVSTELPFIESIVTANEDRKRRIFEYIKAKVGGNRNASIGLYIPSSERNSVMYDLDKMLSSAGINTIIYSGDSDIITFKMKATFIVANRMCDELFDVVDKVITRDTGKI